MGLDGVIWGYMGLYWVILGYMGLYGVILGYMGLDGYSGIILIIITPITPHIWGVVGCNRGMWGNRGDRCNSGIWGVVGVYGVVI